jgi:hypothetical protein
MARGAPAVDRKDLSMNSYYVHIDFRTPNGDLAWFDGVVEAPSLHAAALRAEERAGTAAKSLGKYTTRCQVLRDQGTMKGGIAA